MENKIWVASFDIGTKNLAFCIEEFDQDLLDQVKKIAKTKRYLTAGESTPEFKKELKKVCGNGRIVLLQLLDVTTGCDDDKYLDHKVFLNTTSVLDEYTSFWRKCAAFVIEQQMSFAGRQNYGFRKKVLKINTKAIKVGQHVYSYFSILYGGIKPVFEFPSYHKTQVLGAPKKLTDAQRKKWAVSTAKSILCEREDLDTLTQIDNYAKLDDVCDTIVQIQAWKYLMYVDRVDLN